MKYLKKIKQILMPKPKSLISPQERLAQLDREMEELKEELAQPELPVEGDGKAVFLEFGTDEEYEDMVLKEDKGWGGFLKKVFNPNENDETNEEQIDGEDPNRSEEGRESATSSGEGGSEEGR